MVQIEMKQYQEGTEMTPILVEQDAYTIVGFQFEASLHEIEEKKLDLVYYNELLLHKNQIPTRQSDDVLFIHSYPLINNFNRKTDRIKHIMGYRVKQTIRIPDNMTSFTVPACHYMKATHVGSPNEVVETHEFLYNFCAQNKEYTPLGFELEKWDTNYNPFHPSNQIDVFLAVR